MTADAELLVQLLNPGRLSAVVDIGLGPAATDAPYRTMLGKRLCTLVGLEPRLDPRLAPNRSASDLETHLPVAAGDGAAATLRLCNAPGMNSLLAPNPPVLECLGQYASFAQVAAEVPLRTSRLDDIAETATTDFLKIDMQGAELAVLHGGRSRLSQAVAVQTKVCFMPLYQGQALFADVDEELRTQGFIVHVFGEVKQAMIQPLVLNNDPYRSLNHGVYCDIVYVRDFSRIEVLSVTQLKHLALIAHYCFRSYDLTAICMEDLEGRNEIAPDAIGRYMNSVGRGLV